MHAALIYLALAIPPGAPAEAKPAEKLTPAERIVRAERLLDADRKHLAELKGQLSSPRSEWQLAEERFKNLDGQLEEARLRKKRWEERQEANLEQRKAQILKELAETLPKLEKDWQEARVQFNASLEVRKTTQLKVDALALKIKQDEEALSRLKGEEPRKTEEPRKAEEAKSPQEPEKLGAPSSEAPKHAGPGLSASPSTAASALMPGLAALPTAIGEGGKKANPELDLARQEAQRREEALAAARDKSRSITERVDALKKNIELEQKLLVVGRQKSDADRKRQMDLDEELKARQRAGAPDAELQAIWRRIADAERAFTESRNATRASSVRLSQLQEELTNLQAEQIAALQEEGRTTRAAEAARLRVEELKNPYTLHNVLQWLINRGPFIAVTLVGMWLLHRLVKLSSARIAFIMAQHALRGSMQDRENRAKTLVSVFSNAATLVILGGGGIMILDAIGVPIIPLMGGAAIFGLALAFGAQNLIKDYFAGFMVLLEDQYSVNDVVQIGSVAGVVENISLRVTVLRDQKGVVHFIPHSSIQTVSNLTHGWSRAYFELGVAYRENVDRVMQVLVGLAKELRRDPAFGPLILDEAEMLGVDDFADSAVKIRFFMKTQPLQQWKVKREMLRRIKNRFDELGIEIPFPQRTLYHRYEDAALEKLAGRKAA